MTENIDIFCFEDYVLEVLQRELRYQGKAVDMEPRAFDVLVYLVLNSDRAVDKNELQDAIWPGMIVTETAMTRAVMKARKAVGDDASAQRFIKTLHGHGYRFVAEVLLPDKTSPPDSETQTAVAGQTPASNFRLVVFAIVTVIYCMLH